MPRLRPAPRTRAGRSPQPPRSPSKRTLRAYPRSISRCCASAAAPGGSIGAWNGIVTRADLPKRRFLALWFPWLSTDRLRLEEHDGGHPLALVEKQRGAMRLTACNAAAHALGLAPGLPLADARVRVPDLAVADADPAADARLLARLADACDRYTPLVALDPPTGLTLDVTGSVPVFGSETAVLADLGRQLEIGRAHV